jgi:hypothetical protein
MKTLIKKKVSHAFRKDIYLLGADKDGTFYWLEAPKWDCGWYWGFGYVETYTNNKSPERSKDISSHQHIDSSFLGQVGGVYVHNLHDCPKLHQPTFTEKEGWELSELFKQFYLLKEFAAFTGKELPGCHVTTSPVNHGDLKDWTAKINKELIPAVTAKIIEILSPTAAAN